MSKPKVFIGSSQKNLRVAKLIAEGLEDCAKVTTWDEGVFGLNRGFFETLLETPTEYDFAVFVLAPDDMTTSKDETKPSTRDNVLLESGLFLGVLGRDRVFLVYEETAGLKIPSDLAGVTLATYDGTEIEGADAPSAVRKACRLISDNIKSPRLPHLVGEWKSVYRKTDEEGQPLVSEDVEISACSEGIHIATKSSTLAGDHYAATGCVAQKRQIHGKWESCAESCDTSGIFILTVSPSANYMYGYFTSPDEDDGVTYTDWVLAKKTGVDEVEVGKRLKKGQDRLAKATINLPTQSSDS